MTDLHAPAPRARWESWVVRVATAVAVDPELIDIDAIHGLTRAVADALERPLAPVSSFILGVAAQADGDLAAPRRVIEATLPTTVSPDERSSTERSGGVTEPERRHREAWDEWVVRACAAVGVDAALVDIDQILAMTKQVAHRFERPMAPVSSFILGAALATGSDLDDVRRRIEATLPADDSGTP